MGRWIKRVATACGALVLVVCIVGTTSVFPYIAGPVVWAARQGVPTVEINPDDTTVSGVVEHRLRMSAAEALPELWRRMHPPEPAEDRLW